MPRLAFSKNGIVNPGGKLLTAEWKEDFCANLNLRLNSMSIPYTVRRKTRR
jgi:hypothetical protein